MRRGFTLIELMISVAILGVGVLIAGDQLVQARAEVARVVQRKRALQALEYRADALTRGRPVDPEVERALLAELPGAELSAQALAPGVTELRLRWRASGREDARALRVVGVKP